VLADFATVGSSLVVILLLTGLANAFFILRDGDPWAALAAPYGQLLALKMVLFVGMLGLAVVNRLRLTPALSAAVASGDPERTLKPLRRSIVLEFGLGIGILVLVAWLGTLAPNTTPVAS
jgi:putative copper resistance protein D